MASKKRGLGDGALGWIEDTRKPGVRPRTKPSMSKKGTRPGWTRATFIVREDLLEKLKGVAYHERKEIKDVVDEALTQHLKGRRAQTRPERK